ncbi:Scr1 family TA system antitoxin-like transcriptional regulator [Streptomyces sp. NPDC055186]
MQFGGRKIARAQLEYLLELSERLRVQLLVVPFSAGTFSGAGQTVNYLEGPVPQLDTVRIDNSHGPDFLGEQAQLAECRAHLDWTERVALARKASRDVVRDIVNGL